MATHIGLSSAKVGGQTVQFYVYTTGLKEGACTVADSTNKGVKAPGGAAAAAFVGIITNAQTSSGTTSGDPVDIQISGVANVLLDAGQAVTYGEDVVISDTDGSVKAYANGSMDDCSIVGMALVTKTAGASNEMIPVLLRGHTVRKDNS